MLEQVIEQAKKHALENERKAWQTVTLDFRTIEMEEREHLHNSYPSLYPAPADEDAWQARKGWFDAEV